MSHICKVAGIDQVMGIQENEAEEKGDYKRARKKLLCSLYPHEPRS